MRIVFYSSNSNFYDKENLIYTTIPSWNELWNQFILNHPENTFFTVSQEPAMFMPESTIIINSQNTIDFANKILELSPDLVIALSFWVTPFDWLPVKDALIADELRKNDIKVICHSKETSILCFDKYRTMNFLQANNFSYAPGIFVDHDLYFCAGNQKDVKENVYKECLLSQLKQMEYPLIIKDTIGLSSYGMTVVENYSQAYGYLQSKKNNSNRIIEKYIKGEQFGTEIYGYNGNYTIMPPFKFSVNQYGITSPKLSTKTGPITDEKYNIQELNSELFRLANSLKLCGFAQIDLVFSENKWYIIEINPRLSGMTTTYAASANMNFYEYLYQAVNNKLDTSKLQKTENHKIPLQTKDELQNISKQNNVLFISQINNYAAKQEREKGYCEIISKNYLP